MSWCILLFTLLANGTQGFAPAAIRWVELPAKTFVMSPHVLPTVAKMPLVPTAVPILPQKLTILDASSRGPAPQWHGNAIPRFTMNADKTIRDSSGLCVEASGEASVSVSHCTGGPKQQWNVLPWGNGGKKQIQLKDTNQCLNVHDHQGGGLNGAPVELRSCDHDRLQEAWDLEEVVYPEEAIPLPKDRSRRRSRVTSSIKRVVASGISLAAVGALSLITLRRRSRQKTNAVATDQGDMQLCEKHGGVNLINSSVSAVMQIALSPSYGRMPPLGEWDVVPPTSDPKFIIRDRRPDNMPLMKDDDQDGCLKELPRPRRYRSSDWFRSLIKTHKAKAFKRIRQPVLTNICWSIMVAIVWRLTGFPGESYPNIHSLIGSAMGLLLVFRTNVAYARFWEACKLWEGLLQDSRSLARMAMLYENELTRVKARRVQNLICAFASVMAIHLGQPTRKEPERLLDQADLQGFYSTNNQPLWIANVLGKELRTIPDKSEDDQSLFSARERMKMMSHVDKMVKCLGACERLVQQPVPINYPHHAARVLAVWTLTLPLALVGKLGYAIVPIVGLVSWALFGIQEIGLMIEDPFADRRVMDLDKQVKTIWRDVAETVSMAHGDEVPAASMEPLLHGKAVIHDVPKVRVDAFGEQDMVSFDSSRQGVF